MRGKIKGHYVLISIWSVLLFLSSFTNPDAHHDGIILHYGSLAGKGLIPHEDFYSQWGPLFSYFVTIPQLLQSDLYVLRLFSLICFLILAIVYMKFLNLMGLEKLTLPLSILFCLSYPGLIVYGADNNHPFWNLGWPNQYAFTFLLASLIFLIDKSRLTDKRSRILLGALFLQISPYIRFNFFPLTISLTFVLAFYYFRQSRTLREFTWFTIASASTNLFILGSFYWLGILDEWWTQNFLDPLLNDSIGVVGSLNSEFIIGYAKSHLILSIVLLFTVFAFTRKTSSERILYPILLSIYGIIVFLFTSSASLNKESNRFLVWTDKVFQDMPLSYISLSLVYFPAAFVYLFLRRGYRDQNLTILAVGSLFSFPLLHNLNVDYIWMNSYFLIPFVLRIYNEGKKRIFDGKVFVQVSLHICAVWILIIASRFTVAEKFTFTDPPLNGMLSTSRNIQQEISGNLKLISNLNENKNVVSICNDFLYEASENFNPSSLSTRRLFRDEVLNERIKLPTELTRTDALFVCGINEKELGTLKLKFPNREFIQFRSDVSGNVYISVLIRLKGESSGGG